MFSFVKCPFCSGHEAVSLEAAGIIRQSIALHLHRWRTTLTDSAICELENICDVILNTQEREEPAKEYTPLICPTPDKRKYSNLSHAQPDATKWCQHPYKCDCGFWHLSKQHPTEHKAKINSPAAGADEFDTVDPLLT